MSNCIPLPKCIQEMDSDTVEKIQGYIAMGGMFVKILMASFPMMFVPQLCNNEPCSMADKFLGWNWLMAVNVITFGTFCNLYYIQTKREFFMIDYFDEDDEKSENALFQEIEHYPLIKKKINKLNKHIGKSNNACILFFGINTIWSASFILAQRYLDATTITVLLTNSILVQGKLMQIRDAHTSEDLAQSSVAVKPKKFNIIDLDKRNLELGIYTPSKLAYKSEKNDIDSSIHGSKDKNLNKMTEEPPQKKTTELKIETQLEDLENPEEPEEPKKPEHYDEASGKYKEPEEPKEQI